MGNDTYLYARGEGADIFYEASTQEGVDAEDALYLSGITDFYITKIYDDLMLLFSLDSGDNDSVTIKDWFKADKSGKGLDYIALPDLGYIYNTGDIANLATDVTPTGVNLLSVNGMTHDLSAVNFDALTPVAVDITGVSPVYDIAPLDIAC